MIKDKRITIAGIHFNHRLWMNQIAFCKAEIKIFQERLEEIAKKNSGKDVQIEIEHYQNNFIIQSNEMDIIVHKIRLHEHHIASKSKIGLYPAEDLMLEDHNKLKVEMNQFNKIYSELREDFFKFISSRM